MKKLFTKQTLLVLVLALTSWAATAQVVITEIMFNPPEGGTDSVEYIEIYNNSEVAISLDGWSISDGVNFSFGMGTIGANQYLIIAKNDTAFYNYFGFMPYGEWVDSGLSNNNENIAISDGTGAVVDSVHYDDGGDWPGGLTDGGGASLVLCDVDGDNNLPSSWMVATTEVAGLIIDDKQVYANPGADSGCPTSMVLNNDYFTTVKDVTAIFDVLENDVLVSDLTSLVASTPSLGGTVTVTANNKVEYTPPVGVCGIVESFDYTVTAADGTTGTATVQVIVDCAPNYSIGVLTTENADGVADSTGVVCTITGTAYGVNLKGSIGLQFTVIDDNGDGIAIYSGGEDFGYTVAEGDIIKLVGTVGQYKGLTQFYPTAITKVGTGSLVNPMIATSLGEDTESKLILIEAVHLVDPAQWTNSGSGFNVKITNGSDTLTMRIDNDVDIYGDTDYPGALTTFSVIGIGSQYDGSAPYTSGYQIFPRYVTDLLTLGVNSPALQAKIEMYPNPTADNFVVKTNDLKVDEIVVVNSLGQVISKIANPNATQVISLEQMPAGMYFVHIISGEKYTTMKLKKN